MLGYTCDTCDIDDTADTSDTASSACIVLSTERIFQKRCLFGGTTASVSTEKGTLVRKSLPGRTQGKRPVPLSIGFVTTISPPLGSFFGVKSRVSTVLFLLFFFSILDCLFIGLVSGCVPQSK